MVSPIGPPIKLGTQGLTCGSQGFGCMSMGLTAPNGQDLYGKKPMTQQDVNDIMKRAVELGCNHFDTAQIYQHMLGLLMPALFKNASFLQNSEMLLKGAIAAVGRDKVVIATKVDAVTVKRCGAKDYIKKTCYESCDRMGIECIDLFYMHRIDQKTPVEISMEAMNELKSEGKIKYVGLSEASAATIRRAHAVCPITCVQMEWSLWARDIEDSDIIPTLNELGIGLVAYSPLGRGMLTGTVKHKDMSGLDYRKIGKVGYCAKEDNLETVDALKVIADKKEVTTSELSLAWLHKYGSDKLGANGIVPIPGTSQIPHMESNLKAVQLAKALTAADMDAIEKAVPKEKFSDPTYRYGPEKHVWYFDENISMADYAATKSDAANCGACEIM